VLKTARVLADTLTVRRSKPGPVFHSRPWSVRASGRGPALIDDECRVPSDFAVLHGVDIAGTGEPLQHLVVGPTGIFVVRTYATTSIIEIGTGRRWRDGHPVLAECERVAWEAIVTSDALGALVTPVLCLVGTMNHSGAYRVGTTIVCGRNAAPTAICDRPQQFDHEVVDELVQATRRRISVG